MHVIIFGSMEYISHDAKREGALDVDGMKFGNKYFMTKDAPNILY